jgi:hypothetical protein
VVIPFVEVLLVGEGPRLAVAPPMDAVDGEGPIMFPKDAVDGEGPIMSPKDAVDGEGPIMSPKDADADVEPVSVADAYVEPPSIIVSVVDAGVESIGSW